MAGKAIIHAIFIGAKNAVLWIGMYVDCIGNNLSFIVANTVYAYTKSIK